MFNIAALILVVSAVFVLYRAIKGPRAFDRVLAVNFIGTKAVILLILIGYIYERPYFMDIALVYALINFISTIAFLKYRAVGRLG